MNLSIENLAFGYSKERLVLQDVSLAVQGGEVLGILGTNGTGKTTLLKCVNKILPVAAGRVSFNNMDLLSLSQSTIAKLIAYVPQYAGTIAPVTVFDFILQGRLPHAGVRFSAADKKMAQQLLQKLALERYAFKQLHELSGGERQRVLIARALAQQPQLLILDEPTSSLDLHNQLFILELISAIAKEQQLAVILTIHDLNLAAMFCDKLLMLQGGRVFAYGAAAEIITEENIRCIYNVSSMVTTENGYRHVRLLREPPPKDFN